MASDAWLRGLGARIAASAPAGEVDALGEDDDDAEDAEPACAPESSEDQGRAAVNRRLRKIVSRRLVEARELAGFGQSEAAVLLGYRNSTQLSLVEQGRRLPPLDLLLRAATAYSVTLDYLMGVVEDPERDPRETVRRTALIQVRGLLEASTVAIVEGVLIAAEVEAGGHAASAPLLRAADDVIAAVQRVRELNADAFDDLRAGALLVRAVRQLEEEAATARRWRGRHMQAMAAAHERARAAGVGFSFTHSENAERATSRNAAG